MDNLNINFFRCWPTLPERKTFLRTITQVRFNPVSAGSDDSDVYLTTKVDPRTKRVKYL